MPLIYRFTHTPTGKIYIGAKKSVANFDNYCSSSTVVRQMMQASPIEWSREIIACFDDSVEFEDVVQIEQQLIADTVAEHGWDSVWNKHYSWGLGAGFSPESNAKRAQSLNTAESRARNSQRMTEYFADATNRQHQSVKRKQWIQSHPDAVVGDCSKGGKSTIAGGKGSFGDPILRLESARKGGKKQGQLNSQTGHTATISRDYWKKVMSGELIHPKLMWITDGNTTKQIPSNGTIPDGFRRGRTLKVSATINKKL